MTKLHNFIFDRHLLLIQFLPVSDTSAHIFYNIINCKEIFHFRKKLINFRYVSSSISVPTQRLLDTIPSFNVKLLTIFLIHFTRKCRYQQHHNITSPRNTVNQLKAIPWIRRQNAHASVMSTMISMSTRSG